MNPVKIYDNFGSLKKVISSKELQKRADMLITNPSQYRKTNKNKNFLAKSSEIRSKWFKEAKGVGGSSPLAPTIQTMGYGLGRSPFFVVGNIMGIKWSCFSHWLQGRFA